MIYSCSCSVPLKIFLEVDPFAKLLGFLSDHTTNSIETIRINTAMAISLFVTQSEGEGKHPCPSFILAPPPHTQTNTLPLCSTGGAQRYCNAT